MAKKTTLQVQIDKPCRENWDAMTSETERRRHCQQCQKSVVDFTQMSDGQLVHFLTTSKGSVCGRLRSDQLHRPLTRFHPEHSSWRKMAAVIATLSLWGGNILAQNSATASENKSIQLDTDTRLKTAIPSKLVSGFVSDQLTGELLVGANVAIMGTSTGTITSEDGYFQLKIPAGTMELSVSYMGYNSQLVVLSEHANHLEINLKKGIDLEAIVVTSYSYMLEDDSIVMGGIIGRRVETATYSERDAIKEEKNRRINYLQAAIASPNPSHLPPRLTIDSPLDHQLKLQLFDASGRLLWQNKWELIPGHNQLDITSNWNNWPKGTYFLALEDEEEQKQMLTLVKQ